MSVEPYIPPEKVVKEFTARAIILGVILSVVMGAANAYLGLKVGMTVSATIPSAVIAMAVFRSLRGTVLEINLAKTMGSAGEALAAGVIFTIPAYIIIGAWTEINYWVTTMIALMGGVLGVLFTVSLRRILVVEEALPYPEGVACTEVVIAGEKGGTTAKYVFTALGIGAIYKFLSSGLGIMKDRIQGIISVGKAKFFGGADLSAALLGIGYIVGPRIASYVFLGGILGWVVITPIFLTMASMGMYPLPEGTTMLEALSIIRREQVVWIGIGAITIGGIYTMFSLRQSMKSAFGAVVHKKKSEIKVLRTEKDLPYRLSFGLAGAMVIPIFALYWYLSNSATVAGISAIVLTIFAFFFTAIAGYLAGVVGSSNNPISGVTITTLLFTSLLLLSLGVRGNEGMAVALGVGAVVCCAAAIAGDVMQDFKTGQLLGSTPMALQIGEMIAVVAMAFVIAPILIVLHKAYGIGGDVLPAPQAYVMGGLLNAMFGKGMNFIMFLVGAELAFLLIIMGVPVLPVAIGIYLPFTLTTPIMLGGLINYVVSGAAKMKGIKEDVHSTGVLYSSGLVAGEALMGIIVAFMLVANIRIAVLPKPLPVLGELAFLFIAYLLIKKALSSSGLELSDAYSYTRISIRRIIERARRWKS